MKKTYQDPKLQVEFFAIRDIITTSGDETDDTTGGTVIGPGGLPIVPNSTDITG